MIRKIVTVLKYVARICVAMIHVIIGKKQSDCTCECADELMSENNTDAESSEKE